MTKQEQETFNMLEYIATKYSGIRKCGDAKFELDVSFGLSAGCDKRDCNISIIDFNKKTIEIYSYDESHHNGDHYNCITSNVDWDNLKTYHSFLEKTAIGFIGTDVYKDLINKLSYSKLEEIKARSL